MHESEPMIRIEAFYGLRAALKQGANELPLRCVRGRGKAVRK